jgi:hypothetical protein
MNLDEWNAQHGIDEDELAKATSNRFEFEFGKSYAARVTSSKALTSSFGSRQIELKLDILNGDESVAGKTTEWITLPKQPETDCSLKKETVAQLTMRRRDDLRVLLAAAEPDTYTIPPGTKGKEWEKKAFEINKLVMARADELHREIEDNAGGGGIPGLQDAVLYFVKVPNKKKPEYPYTNWSVSPKPGYPKFTGSAVSEDAIPF